MAKLLLTLMFVLDGVGKPELTLKPRLLTRSATVTLKLRLLTRSRE